MPTLNMFFIGNLTKANKLQSKDEMAVIDMLLNLVYLERFFHHIWI